MRKVAAIAVMLAMTVLAAPPVANPDSYQTVQDTPVSRPAPAGVLANDTGGELTVTLYTTAGNGEISMNTNGSFTYTPNSGFWGVDTFDYQCSNGEGTSQATVTVTVQKKPWGKIKTKQLRVGAIGMR